MFDGTIIKVLDKDCIIIRVKIPRKLYVGEPCCIELYGFENKEESKEEERE